MPIFSLNGDFAAHLDEIFETLESGIARGGGTGLSISGGFPYGVTLTGSHLFFPSSGPEFLTGNITGVKLTFLELGIDGSGNTFTDLLLIDGLQIDASVLYTLIDRTGGTTAGFFESEVMRAALDRGNQTISGSDNDDVVRPTSFVTLGGNDAIWGRGGNDTLFGGAGDDVLVGGDGNDLIDTGSGRNRARGEDGDDELRGGTGADALFGGNGLDRISGNGGNDTIGGGNGADQLSGGSGHDRIWGGTGFDTVSGGFGNDSIAGANGRDTLFGDDGNDAIFGGGYADRLAGGNGNDTLFGGTGSDQIFAGAGADVIDGGAHGDLILGGGGADTLNGGRGNDTLEGGDGLDVFVFTEGQDLIRDLTQGDRIDLSALAFLTGFGDLDSRLSQTGADVVLSLGAGNSLTLLGTSLSDLGAEDFLF